MSDSKTENKIGFDTVPDGFIKMDLELTLFKKEHVHLMEKQIIRNILCGYYLLYSKKFVKGEKISWWEFRFYCQPSKREHIAYEIGLYAQCLIGFHTENKILNSSHKVADGFPKSVQIKWQAEK